MSEKNEAKSPLSTLLFGMLRHQVVSITLVLIVLLIGGVLA